MGFSGGGLGVSLSVDGVDWGWWIVGYGGLWVSKVSILISALMGFDFDFDFDYVVDDGRLGLGAEKMRKICRKIAFSECYQTPKIIF